MTSMLCGDREADACFAAHPVLCCDLARAPNLGLPTAVRLHCQQNNLDLNVLKDREQLNQIQKLVFVRLRQQKMNAAQVRRRD